MNRATAAIDCPATDQFTHHAGQSVLLHLAPGLAAMAVYIAAVPVMSRAGLPTIAALAVSGLLGVVPVQLALLARHRRRHPDDRTPHLRARLPGLHLLAYAALEVLLGAGAFALTAPLARLIRARAFSWWPSAWIIDAGTSARFTTQALLVTAGLMALGTVIAAPLVEEHYFRGFLLPRMPRSWGRAAPAWHAALFAGYHVWTPWLSPTRALAILPLAYIAIRTRDIRIGILAHVVLNAVDLALLAAYLL